MLAITESSSTLLKGLALTEAHMKEQKRNSTLLDVFTLLFIVSLLAANIIAVKLVQFGPFIIPAGTIVFPISYIVNDILTEVYGFKTARRVIWLGFFSNLFLVIAIYIAQILPAAPFWNDQQAYEKILGFTPRLLAASFLAYLTGSFLNAWVMSKMKLLTKERWLWTRTIGSTIVGEGVDAVIFITIAFVGTVPAQGLINSVVTIWILKTLYEAISTPFTYYVIDYVKRLENLKQKVSVI